LLKIKTGNLFKKHFVFPNPILAFPEPLQYPRVFSLSAIFGSILKDSQIVKDYLLTDQQKIKRAARKSSSFLLLIELII